VKVSLNLIETDSRNALLVSDEQLKFMMLSADFSVHSASLYSLSLSGEFKTLRQSFCID